MATLTTVRVGDLCDQIRGVTYSKADVVDVAQPGFKPVLRANSITDAGLTFDDLVFVPASKIGKQQFVKANDIVIAASSGSIDVVGKAARALSDFDGGFGAFCKVLRPNGKVEPGYFAHFFQTRVYRRRVSELAAGANINNLRNEHLDDLEIPLPPLPEQHRIAAILDKADALRAKRREAIAKLDQLLQSVFLDMFGDPVTNPKGWPRVALRDVLDRIDSGKSPVCLDRPAKDGEWAVLKLGAVTRCEFQPSSNKALPDTVAADPDLEVKEGDLLFTRKNTFDLVAACAFVSRTPPRLLLPDLIFRLRIKSDAPLLPRFLHALLIHPGKRKEIQSLAGGSAGSMPNISKAKLMSACIELPPKDLQKKYSDLVVAIEKQRSMHRLSVSGKHTLFAALQRTAFAGE